MKNTLRNGLAGMGLALASAIATAAPVQWAGNGHWYEVVAQPLNPTWDYARQAALWSSHQGMKGYLATVTSQAESDFISALALGKHAWIGASDQGSEGEWTWMDGPEAGLVFWLGVANGRANGYANWKVGEPNNSRRGSGEDFAHIQAQGLWNDAAIIFSAHSVVEYGANAVPLPGSLSLVALALGGLGLVHRRRGSARI